MHRTDDDAFQPITSSHGASVNGYSGGDPAVPRLPTQLSPDVMNALQEELLTVLDEASIAPVKGLWNQLLASLRVLFLDVVGGVGQTIAKFKVFQDGITVTRSTANSTAISGTGKGSGLGGNFAGSSDATNGGTGLSAGGGIPGVNTGNGGKGAAFTGGGFNAGSTGNTTGTAGEGVNITGGSITADANARVGGTGVIVSGGTGQAGRGKAIDAQNGDVNIGAGNLTFGPTSTIAIGAPTAITTGSGVGTYANSWGADTSGGKQGAQYIKEPTVRKYLEGSIIGGASLSIAFTLPTALCPPVPKSFTCTTGTLNVFAQVLIDTSGHVTIDFPGGGTSTSVSLDGINYL